MTDASGPTAERRGRPRSPAVDRAVIDTVLRLLTEGSSFAELSMEGIARAAGVGKNTVYRRWSGKDALLLDVLATIEEPAPEPTGRTLHEDLVLAVEWIRQRSLAKRESALMRNMQMQIQSSPELWQRYYDTFIVTRRKVLAQIMERGLANGEIRADLADDVELLVDMVAGPLLTRAVQRPDQPLENDLAERLVDTLLDGLRPRG
ncbi:TetR/AcrR family transcriptional regulator [Kitasatospora cheerisanensis]|uniref:Efflux membrane protein n=1 Tax=Kitasatospora cheerisanensis KCTC 2395 TaxID=1348663 RepID=A0A066Z125_9ACTN|nr:TetR/AcrR family transcriptional regulator [Kitasatospora cheerisanensis]KDN83870.1 efflux membrane protein [Kitasatospora cheerisanensis KCTC 2395]